MKASVLFMLAPGAGASATGAATPKAIVLDASDDGSCGSAGVGRRGGATAAVAEASISPSSCRRVR
jgi:hypothetical protein